MAQVTSLGMHTPIALPYLIREGILPREPKPDQYQWRTYTSSSGIGHDDIDEEVLATKYAVVWSQGSFVRSVFRFDLDGEEVVSAVLTDFEDDRPPSLPTSEASPVSNGYDGVQKAPKLPPHKGHQTADSRSTTSGKSLARGLVVLLKTKVHIHFLGGRSHIVDLPFEVEQVHPAPRGVLLQRKTSPAASNVPASPFPRAPPNSFFSSQAYSAASFLQSPTLIKSFQHAQPVRPSPLGVGTSDKLNALYKDIVGAVARYEEEGVANLFSLSSPLADLGIVSFSNQHPRPRLSARSLPASSIEFEPLDPAERVLYVSQRDELRSIELGTAPLIFVVTINQDLQTITIWHAWYAEECSLTHLVKQRAVNRDTKARRRSSFMSTGATTPAPRARDNMRESFAAPGTLRLPGDTAGPATSQKAKKLDEEAVMASQMDPDYQPSASQQSARENRRISSNTADLRVANPAMSTTYHSRRHTSFGITNDRKSFGHRKSRASTPGSVFSRSVGVDDDTMDIDSDGDMYDQPSPEQILRHMRATIEAASADNVFGTSEERFRRELIVRRVHTLSLPSSTPVGAAVPPFRIVVVTDDGLAVREDERETTAFLHDQASGDLTCLQFRVKIKDLWPELQSSSLVPIPVLKVERSLAKCTDITKVQDGEIEAVLLANKGLHIPPGIGSLCPIPKQVPYRAYAELQIWDDHRSQDPEVGRNRLLSAPTEVSLYAHPGCGGIYDEKDGHAHLHRRRMQLRPNDKFVRELLKLCRVILPDALASDVLKNWCAAAAKLNTDPAKLSSTAYSVEWVALVASIFIPVFPLLDSKARASLTLSALSSGTKSVLTSPAVRLQRRALEDNAAADSTTSWLDAQTSTSSTSPRLRSPKSTPKDQVLVLATATADELSEANDAALALKSATRLMLALHVFQEEQRLQETSGDASGLDIMTILILQLGQWLGSAAWSPGSSSYYGTSSAKFDHIVFVQSVTPLSHDQVVSQPVGFLDWFGSCMEGRVQRSFPLLSDVILLEGSPIGTSKVLHSAATKLTPRMTAICALLQHTDNLTCGPAVLVEALGKSSIDKDMLDSLPEAISAPLQEAIARCEQQPPTTWDPALLHLVGREDLVTGSASSPRSTNHVLPVGTFAKDIQTVCNGIEQPSIAAKSKEAHRHAISQLIFREDRRLVEAMSLMHYNSVQVAECLKQPDWTDAQHFESQRRLMQWVTTRMIALPAGDAMLHYDSQTPLLAEKYHVPGFSSSCIMQPMRHVMTTDRSVLTEEKVSWAYFHAGVSAGLRISRQTKGIDTSWVAFNKPNELTNRHAGLLLALGLGGHLRSLAKWLSFKYLTPKHNMTSVGLLLGLSASYIGTTDSLVTRMLSVHITRMLPAGAAELNVSPMTQTAGLMGIGMLYHNTQHRRMSEIMLSEIEHMEAEDPDSGPDPLRDESYRLAAGFAFGLINLAKGKNMNSLHGMAPPERLLAVAIGPRPVSAVHVFDRATAGAIIAIALVYLKTGDKAIARKIDVPDTEAQFDHVRPDILLLRATAKHLILWDGIRDPGVEDGLPRWIQANLPECYKTRLHAIEQNKARRDLLNTTDVPFYNITTGLAWALAFKFAGSAHEGALAEIIYIIDRLYMLKEGGDYYYDAKLARATIRRCIDTCALSAAMIMAGTGDLTVFRYLRRLHGRTDADTPYGSHMAAHLGIGLLFLGGGTYTLGTSDLAIAMMLCAFYPLFPVDVQDNRCHLQAMRHLWVFAAEARCFITEDIDTQRPVSLPILVTMKGDKGRHNVRRMQTPCLLPDLDQIAEIQTDDPTYWKVTLDFQNNPLHLKQFRREQRILVRRCPAAEAHSSTFSSTLAALADSSMINGPIQQSQPWQTLFDLRALRDIEKADVELILPPDLQSSIYADERRTVVDDRLILARATGSNDADELWNLKALFAWAERCRHEPDERLRWIGRHVLEALKASVERRTRGERAMA